MAKLRSYIIVAALAVGASVLTATGASAQSTSATVHASATILSAVGLQAPASLSLQGQGSDLSLNGALEVTSPAPHVLTGQVEAWGREGSLRDFSRVRPGRLGTLPEEVRVEGADGSGAGVVHVTYTVAVIL